LNSVHKDYLENFEDDYKIKELKKLDDKAYESWQGTMYGRKMRQK
jgi:hypothetical protein